jgi:DNA-binding MarR family transcriptional regulator
VSSPAVAELVEAGYVEEYTGEDGQQAMRLTPSGEQVARQLAMVDEDGAAAMMAGLLGDELEEPEG